MLDAVSPLGGFSAEINEVSIKEISGRTLVSIAVPKEGLSAVRTAVKKQLKLDLSEPGQTSHGKTTSGLLIWTSPDQFLYAFDELNSDPAATLQKQFAGKAYITDQSDAWVTLEVSGQRRLEALERICPINLQPGVFKTGMAARTMMEHLGVLIIRDQDERFLLMSARSTAASLAHAIETSAKNLM